MRWHIGVIFIVNGHESILSNIILQSKDTDEAYIPTVPF